MQSKHTERRAFLKHGASVILGNGTEAIAQPAMIFDESRCSGCQSCVIACVEHNHTPVSCYNTKINRQERGAYPNVALSFMAELCHQCEDAPCAESCENNAIITLINGVVITDWQKCQGDGNCVEACPYDARFQDSASDNRSGKCNFCVERFERGLAPVCVESCPSRARIFGDLAQPSGEFAVYLKKVTTDERENGERLFVINSKK